MDADGQHDPADVRRLLDASASSWPALVVGARLMEGSGAPRSSVFGRDFSNFWVRLECGQALPDTQSGYRLYPVELLSAMRFLFHAALCVCMYRIPDTASALHDFYMRRPPELRSRGRYSTCQYGSSATTSVLCQLGES